MDQYGACLSPTFEGKIITFIQTGSGQTWGNKRGTAFLQYCHHMIAAPNNTYAGIRSVQYGAAGHKYVDFNPYEAIEEAFDLSGKRSPLSRQFILKNLIIYQDRLGTNRLKALKKRAAALSYSRSI